MNDMNDHHQDENKLIALRRSKLSDIRARREAYPNDFKRGDLTAGLQTKYGEQTKADIEKQKTTAAVAGRIVRMRGPFIVIQDGSGRIQLYMNGKDFTGEAAEELKALDLGDIIGAEGGLFKTDKGELTVRVASFRLLVKALRPLPDKHKGLQDTELRYRRRYVDLIVNEDSRRVFQLRSRILHFIRDYFQKQDFMEVETPMMHVTPGGAVARPFVTHHEALDQKMYLRVAPELYLKRLVVGGFEKVFELNRSFRNEGLSARHNPEFTMLEFYWAYASYPQLMDFTEDLLRHLAEKVFGSGKFESQGIKYDFSKPFARMTLLEAISQHCHPPDEVSRSSTPWHSDRDRVLAAASSLGVEFDSAWPTGKVLLEIYEQKVERQLQQPTFITEYPVDVSPLSRRNESNPEVADRFELIIGGRELANGFSELNDPEDQAERFKQQAKQRDSGDEEAMVYDADYITALEYGMPPTAGEGIGIDRLVMLLADVASIKDVLLFPHNRPQQD